jgi:hypothetical protein
MPSPPIKPTDGLIYGPLVSFEADEVTTKRCGCRVLRGSYEGKVYEVTKPCLEHKHRDD